MKIQIKPLVKGLKPFELQIDDKKTGQHLIDTIQQQTGIQVTLMHKGKTVEPAKTLREQEIEDEAKIVLT